MHAHRSKVTRSAVKVAPVIHLQKDGCKKVQKDGTCDSVLLFLKYNGNKLFIVISSQFFLFVGGWRWGRKRGG